MIQRMMLIGMVALLTACGPPRLEKPNTNLHTLIEITSLDIGKKRMDIRLSHRQASSRAASSLECRLKIDQKPYYNLPSLQVPALTAYARERLSWILADDFSVSGKERLEYALDCSLQSEQDRTEYFKNHGSLYRLGRQEPPIYR